MPKDLSLYTGRLMYNGICFAFAFDGQELRLIPPEAEKQTINYQWLMEPIANGTYISKPLYMEEPFLVGKCNETRRKIIFITKQWAHVGSYNLMLRVEIVAYIVFRKDKDTIDRIAFSNPEIDCIHPVNRAYEYSFNPETVSSDGIFSVTTKQIDSTTTEQQSFCVDGKDVRVQFSTYRKVSQKIGESPITIRSTLLFEFEETSDYSFIFRLWGIAKEFLRYLCYRKNVALQIARLSSPFGEGVHEESADLYVLGEPKEIETEALANGQLIKQQHIAGHEGMILDDIASGTLYLRHLPNSSEAEKHIDASRFVMITAAFEWEFHRAHPGGIIKDDAEVEMEEAAEKAIQSLIDTATGKLKKKYKFLKKLIKADSLQAEIIMTGEEIDGVIGNFGRGLYQLNGEELVYSDMGERLASQRNHFAHGNLNNDFIGLSLLDLMYLECIVYAMQLRHYGVNDEEIRKSINDLFGLNYIV